MLQCGPGPTVDGGGTLRDMQVAEGSRDMLTPSVVAVAAPLGGELGQEVSVRVWKDSLHCNLKSTATVVGLESYTIEHTVPKVM